ncbi:MAG: ABC transporter permease [Bacteroidota bacterium]
MENKTNTKRVGLSYLKLIWRKLSEDRLAKLCIRVLLVLIFFALFGGWIANEKPFYCKIKGEAHYPLFDELLVELGIKDQQDIFFARDWYQVDYDEGSVVRPLIPYAAFTIDRNNMSAVSPLASQDVSALKQRHWLGTDVLGRDVLAGLIAGTRIALSIGLLAIGIAAGLGIFFGLVSGYFGNDLLRLSLIQSISYTIGLIAAIYWAIYCRVHLFNSFYQVLISILLFAIILFAFIAIGKLMDTRLSGKRFAIPLDSIIMRIIEIVDAMPTLLIVLAALSLMSTKSIYNIMIIIGCIGWTLIARFTRAEAMRIRTMPYIKATKSMGFSHLRIMLNHILPNAIAPVLIVLAFGVAGAIMIEATLSFLGIGLGDKEVSWGYLLNLSKETSKAWWLAIFPGLAIFVTVSLFNLLGESLSDSMKRS